MIADEENSQGRREVVIYIICMRIRCMCEPTQGTYANIETHNKYRSKVPS